MKKRKLTKSEKVTLSKLHDHQQAALLRLKERTSVLIKVSEEILKKIDEKGINNHYSVNSDVLRHAQEVWSTSHRLGELKSMCDDLEYSYGKK